MVSDIKHTSTHTDTHAHTNVRNGLHFLSLQDHILRSHLISCIHCHQSDKDNIMTKDDPKLTEVILLRCIWHLLTYTFQFKNKLEKHSARRKILVVTPHYLLCSEIEIVTYLTGN
jgi:hypothetical protein